MRKDYSRTAEAIALARALEQNAPSSERILDDPYASAFLQYPYFRLIANSRLSSRAISQLMNFWAPGGQEFFAIRARLADDLAKAMAGEGLKQLTLLGAGFDSMALRLKDALGAATIFEVDHPATQAVKRKVMERLGAPENLRFVAVDFEQDDFVEKLKQAGFDAAQRSLVIWMGVSYYLTPQAMARALSQISMLGGAGLRLAFDYILQDVIDGKTRNMRALAAARRVAWLGEPWLFGLRPEQVGQYLSAFSFNLIEDCDPEELRRKYCPRRFKVLDYLRIVVCERAAQRKISR